MSSLEELDKIQYEIFLEKSHLEEEKARLASKIHLRGIAQKFEEVDRKIKSLELRLKSINRQIVTKLNKGEKREARIERRIPKPKAISKRRKKKDVAHLHVALPTSPGGVIVPEIEEEEEEILALPSSTNRNLNIFYLSNTIQTLIKSNPEFENIYNKSLIYFKDWIKYVRDDKLWEQLIDDILNDSALEIFLTPLSRVVKLFENAWDILKDILKSLEDQIFYYLSRDIQTPDEIHIPEETFNDYLNILFNVIKMEEFYKTLEGLRYVIDNLNDQIMSGNVTNIMELIHSTRDILLKKVNFLTDEKLESLMDKKLDIFFRKLSNFLESEGKDFIFNQIKFAFKKYSATSHTPIHFELLTKPGEFTFQQNKGFREASPNTTNKIENLLARDRYKLHYTPEELETIEKLNKYKEIKEENLKEIEILKQQLMFPLSLEKQTKYQDELINRIAYVQELNDLIGIAEYQLFEYFYFRMNFLDLTDKEREDILTRMEPIMSESLSSPILFTDSFQDKAELLIFNSTIVIPHVSKKNGDFKYGYISLELNNPIEYNFANIFKFIFRSCQLAKMHKFLIKGGSVLFKFEIWGYDKANRARRTFGKWVTLEEIPYLNPDLPIENYAFKFYNIFTQTVISIWNQVPSEDFEPLSLKQCDSFWFNRWEFPRAKIHYRSKSHLLNPPTPPPPYSAPTIGAPLSPTFDNLEGIMDPELLEDILNTDLSNLDQFEVDNLLNELEASKNQQAFFDAATGHFSILDSPSPPSSPKKNPSRRKKRNANTPPPHLPKFPDQPPPPPGNPPHMRAHGKRKSSSQPLPQNKKSKKGGWCAEKRGSKQLIHGYVLQSAVGKKGECFFRVIENCLGKQVTELRHKAKVWDYYNRYLRENNFEEIDIQCGVTIQNAIDLRNFLKVDLIIYEFDSQNILQMVADTRLLTPFLNYSFGSAHIVLFEGHWYRLMTNEIFEAPQETYCSTCRKYFVHIEDHDCSKFVGCEDCGAVRRDLTQHECNIKEANFFINKHKDKIFFDKSLTANVLFLDEFISCKNTIVYDLETILDDYKEHKPYACGWILENENGEHKDEFHYEYGYYCLYRFIEFLWNYQSTSEKAEFFVIGYNNSGYDNHFALHELITRNFKVKFLLQPGGNLVTMEFNNLYGVKFKFIDIFRFLVQGSLRNNALSFGLKVQKGDFPYEFVNNYGNIYYCGPIPDEEYWPIDYDKEDQPFPQLPEDYQEIKNNNLKWNLQEECIKYLEKDVRATKEIYHILSEIIFKEFHVDIRNFVTLSHLSYDIWKAFWTPNLNFQSSKKWFLDCFRPTLTNRTIIKLPSVPEYIFIIQGTYGGRVGPNKLFFKHELYDKIQNGEILYEDVKENYLVPIDVTGLYPTAMRDFFYPIGDCFPANDYYLDLLNEIFNPENPKYDFDTTLKWICDFRNFKMGFYRVNYYPPKNLIVPILPFKELKFNAYGETKSGRIEYSLENRFHCVYTSTEIILAYKHGYQFEFLEGIYWEKQEKLFERFINHVVKLKESAENPQTKNPALRHFAKTLMNALFGKMLQKPIIDAVSVINDWEEYDKFLEEYPFITDIITFSDRNEDDHAILKAKTKDYQLQITKPSQLGAFILSYSRWIMQDYYNLFDPERFTNAKKSLENTFFYGDTDSLFIKTNDKYLEQLKDEGIYNTGKLGGIMNDDKDHQGKIIYGIYLSRKCYFHLLLGKDNKIRKVAKRAGIPKRKLTQEIYENALFKMKNTELELKGRFKKSNASGYESHLPFKIITQDMTRTFNASIEEGRDFYSFIDDENYPEKPSLPFGFDYNLLNEIPLNEEDLELEENLLNLFFQQ